MVAALTPMLSLSRPRLVTNWKSDVFLNYTDPSDPDLPHSFKQFYESLYVLSEFLSVLRSKIGSGSV